MNSVSCEQNFETYCMLRGLELDLRMEDSYDFVKFMLTCQELKEKLKLAGIKNLIPVGSAVTKSIRKESFMIDIVLNYSITHESKPV